MKHRFKHRYDLRVRRRPEPSSDSNENDDTNEGRSQEPTAPSSAPPLSLESEEASDPLSTSQPVTPPDFSSSSTEKESVASSPESPLLSSEEASLPASPVENVSSGNNILSASSEESGLLTVSKKSALSEPSPDAAVSTARFNFLEDSGDPSLSYHLLRLAARSFVNFDISQMMRGTDSDEEKALALELAILRRREFSQTFMCYCVARMEGRPRPDVEQGGKIVMPLSALNTLCTSNVDLPFLFRATNPSNEQFTHCGVLEFTAEPGRIYMPMWIMKHLELKDGDEVKITSAKLPPATFTRLRPQSPGFHDITNPQAVLEHHLRNYACLTKGDLLTVYYNNKKYEFEVLETQPEDAVMIIECDVSVDFAPSGCSYMPFSKRKSVEAFKVASSERIEKALTAHRLKSFRPFACQGYRPDGMTKNTDLSKEVSEDAVSEYGIPDLEYEVGEIRFVRRNVTCRNEKHDNVEMAFKSFSGRGQRLVEDEDARDRLVGSESAKIDVEGGRIRRLIFKPFCGVGRRLNGKRKYSDDAAADDEEQDECEDRDAEVEVVKRNNGFKHFCGTGRVMKERNKRPGQAKVCNDHTSGGDDIEKKSDDVKKKSDDVEKKSDEDAGIERRKIGVDKNDDVSRRVTVPDASRKRKLPENNKSLPKKSKINEEVEDEYNDESSDLSECDMELDENHYEAAKMMMMKLPVKRVKTMATYNDDLIISGDDQIK